MKRILCFVICGLLSFLTVSIAMEKKVNPLLIEVKPAKMTPSKAAIFKWLDGSYPELCEINDKIWRYAELALKEYQSAELLIRFLERAGFSVTKAISGMPTAFLAVWGQGNPVIGFLAEYDALPGLSQDTVPYKKPLEEGMPGHGCGHNIFGVASSAAAVALKSVMKAEGIPGTIRLYGCPAEETGLGKVLMARDGIFDDLSCCIQWHPSSKNKVTLDSTNALNQFEVEFFGKTAHAAGDPWQGRSALDAVELTSAGINYLREHIRPSARIHYVIKDGGKAPNIVPDYARVWYFVRELTRDELEDVYNRVLKIIEGAALMTETQYKLHFKSGVHEFIPSRIGNEVVYSNFLLVGAPKFDETEQIFAKDIQKNLGIMETGLKTNIEPFVHPEKSWGGGSTDVAEVSWVTPTTSLGVAMSPPNAPWHHWAQVACGGMSIGHKAMITAAKVMAATGLDFFIMPDIVENMREEWLKKMKGKEYRSPLPSDFEVPLKSNK